MTNRWLLIVCIFIAIVSKSYGQSNFIVTPEAEQWADSVYQSLSLDEKIGQLIFIRANHSGNDYFKNLGATVKEHQLGGVVFFAHNPINQALKTNELNKLTKVPLFFSIDAEWGLGMRLSETVKYPLQMTLGAIDDESMLIEMGKQIGNQCKRMNLHINFAPVVDVNSNPLNPVIGMRSFGEDPKSVASKAYAYMLGMQSEGVIASAKHFPGHGDTKTDSHVTLPVLDRSKKQLRSTELYPFNFMIEKGVGSIMIAHLSVPSLDKRKNYPASLSYKIITEQLKEKMGFKGLIISDALDMKGVTKSLKKKNVALEAFKAGNDILLIPEDISESIAAIKATLSSRKLDESRLEESCKKILQYKFLSGANKRTTVDTANLITDLNQYQYNRQVEVLFKEAVTVVKNENNLVPISFPDTLQAAVLVIGTTDRTLFEEPFKKMMDIPVYRLAHDASVKERQDVLSKLENTELVIVGIVNTNILASKKFGISNGDIQFIERIATLKEVVLAICASPYSLNYFSSTNLFESIVISYQDKPIAQSLTAEVILGMEGARGHLPVKAGGFKVGTGLTTKKTRLTYTRPTDLAIDTSILNRIDSIALNGIDIKAFPGCQIIASKDGYIFYDKCFGHHTYQKKSEVKKSDVYDVASLTKILASTPVIMQMVDNGKIDIDGKVSDNLLYLKGTNKESMSFKEVLAHQSGLEPWIPYYQSTLFNTEWDTSVYRSVISEEFPVRVASNMYIRENYQYNIYESIIQSPVGEKEYAYSDLGFYFFKDMLEHMTNKDFDTYVDEELYNPMGLNKIGFKPLKKFPSTEIIPTERDSEFRHQLLVGDVHDQGAAMLGGVSGHAGLFANAYNVAVVMQMFLNGGNYGGRHFINKETIEMFTSYQFADQENRRGLGFDKPLLEFEEHRTNCKDASPSSYGHSGFTGTYTWADPENGLVYVFLSNRVYPDMDNKKIMELDIRTNIHQLFYESIKNN